MSEERFPIASIAEVSAAFKAGRMVVLVDRADRENEGDIVIPTAQLTPDMVAFMMREARGLTCVSVTSEDAKRLNLPLQVTNNNSPFNTAFTITIDHVKASAPGSAAGRCHTMRQLLDSRSTAEDFISPGHVFPLIAHPAGVLARQGQTEGSVDLARISGFSPSGVICEILNPDGTMARSNALLEFANRHDLLITSVDEIIKYRVYQEVLLREGAVRMLETDYGKFLTHVFIDDVDGKEHLALEYGNPRENERGCLTRIHSECLTGDVFGSRRCDCGPQLEYAMRQVVKEGSGAILYLRQEGRGIGLLNKLRAYALQDLGDDTVEANVKLGFAPDERDFAVAAKILSALQIHKVRLMTNNPRKIETLRRLAVDVTERVPVVMEADDFSKNYLQTKKDKLGHLF